MRLIYISHCIAFLLSVGNLFSQNEKTDLKKMNETYAHAASFSMKIEMQIQSGNEGTNESRFYKGIVKKSGNSYYSDMAGKTTLLNDNYYLLIDNDHKLMICSKPLGKREKGNTNVSEIYEDSSMFEGAKMSYVFANSEHKKIRLNYKEGIFDEIDITINSITYALEEVVYSYRKNSDADVQFSKVVIAYKAIMFNPKFSSADFSENKFIVRSKGKLIPAQLYSDYHLVDQASNTSETQ